MDINTKRLLTKITKVIEEGGDIKEFVNGLLEGKEEVSHITILVDRSGSMSSIARDMEGSLKTFLSDQRELPGECLVTLHTFDDQFETQFTNVPVGEVKDIKIMPRGMTALTDALGKSLAMAKEQERDKNIFIVITDGGENSSRECKMSDVKDTIQELDKSDDWVFVFLGANQDSFSEASNYGIAHGAVMNYIATKGGLESMGMSLNSAVTGYRSATRTKSALFDSTDEYKGADYIPGIKNRDGQP